LLSHSHLWIEEASPDSTNTLVAWFVIRKVASDKRPNCSEKRGGVTRSPSYARTVKEPLVGTLLVSVNVVWVRAVGDVPH